MSAGSRICSKLPKGLFLIFQSSRCYLDGDLRKLSGTPCTFWRVAANRLESSVYPRQTLRDHWKAEYFQEEGWGRWVGISWNPDFCLEGHRRPLGVGSCIPPGRKSVFRTSQDRDTDLLKQTLDCTVVT